MAAKSDVPIAQMVRASVYHQLTDTVAVMEDVGWADRRTAEPFDHAVVDAAQVVAFRRFDAAVGRQGVLRDRCVELREVIE